ncbi:alpha-N-acetylgalactosaminidase-like [Brevipalpus obovatus]|uniref:alpha-N-acetylgalactosaminidase-like n=1 Tax=Brevipalpus obovatus TaxID=246614 RepID=UPI003D9F33D8
MMARRTDHMCTMLMVVLLIHLMVFLPGHYTLDNGLARTPPMGWMTWGRYGCHIDCDYEPDGCISDKLIRTMADIIVEQGYRDVGYEYVNIDDCWPVKDHRDPQTDRLIPDPVRFPNGIKELADYVHSKGLKMGIYGDIGNLTCAGYPGFWGDGEKNYFKTDSDTFAEWGIDSLKVDGCYMDDSRFDQLYPLLGQYLNQTGRPIVYSCSWPAYQVFTHKHPDYPNIAAHCNLWRNFDDIENNFKSIQGIMDFYAQNQDEFSAINGPGAWFDPDMIVVGNGLSLGQSRVQFAIWSILSAPLLMSNNLAILAPELRAVLLNKKVIAVDQDPLGIMGKRVLNKDSKQIWVKPMTPYISGNPSFAIAYVNMGVSSQVFSYKLAELLKNQNVTSQYQVDDLFDDGPLPPQIGLNDHLEMDVSPNGDVRMIKLTPVSHEDYGQSIGLDQVNEQQTFSNEVPTN